MRELFKRLLEALFRVLFTYECVGEENVPAAGPAVVASNHPSYLDPVLLSLQVPRTIRFMAWEALFKVPVLGRLISVLGAFPVDTRKGKGREAYARAKALVEGGEVVGIFPEGRRSRTGWMEPSLRAGAARLAWETGAPLVPATITGAFRAWPHYQSLPRPARVRVRFHPPIDPTPFRGLSEEAALPALLEELRRRVERALRPGVKADLRYNLIWRMPASLPQPHEYAPALALALLVSLWGRSVALAVPPLLYVAYLLLDAFVIPQRRILKWIRTASPLFFLLGYGPVLVHVLGLPHVPASLALGALSCGAFLPYLYEHGRTVMGFVRGFVAVALLELAALFLWPAGLGPQVALPVFAAAYAWERRVVFWRWATPLLAGYAVGIPWLLGGLGLELVPHAATGLLAWLAVRLVSLRGPRLASSAQAAPAGLGLRPTRL